MMCSSVMPEKRKPAGHVHTILLVISGREEGLQGPSRVKEEGDLADYHPKNWREFPPRW